MKKWSVYKAESGNVEVVKEGFNWWAFFFVGLWAFSKGLTWAGIIGLSLIIIANRMPADADIIAIPIIIVLMLVYGIMGNGWVATKLEKKNNSLIRQVEAASVEGAKAKLDEAPNCNSSVNKNASQASSQQIDESFYGVALREVDRRKVVQSLWAKSFAESNGDINNAKAMYIRLRASQLHKHSINEISKEKQRVKKNDSPSEQDEMQNYGITFDGEHYHYQNYKYEKLSDALNYAKLQKSKKYS
ncbi:hypothetical protein DJ030_09510 [bacterium endosymbiont of Escarpia laminata]|nr:MAG: hypothetical protein DJ030_09510 [bacterium endosymbiont of Escarpia laminata]